MKKIRNYNPDLGITLKDIKMLLTLDTEDDYGLNLVADVIDCVVQSVEQDITFTFEYRPKQIVYDSLMEKVEPAVEEYENQLIEQGYTQEDIDEYHRKKYEENHKNE